MNSCTFNGRLGNNMFQIAATLSVAKKVGEEVIFPHTTYAGHRGTRPVDLSMFGCYYPRGETPVGNAQYNEKSDEYSEIPVSKNLTLSGFFQSYKYFEDIKSDLLNKWFVPNDAIQDRLAQYEVSPNSVGVSVRRGDYLMLQDNHCVLGSDYYNTALETYCQNGDKLFVFSDDYEWCRTIFGDATYVQEETGAQLFLMTKMRYLVLSNSTFAWWGGYLNTNATVVIPDPWYGPNYDGRGKGLVYPKWNVVKHDRKIQAWQMGTNMYN